MDGFADETTHPRAAKRGEQVIEFYRSIAGSGLDEFEALTDLIADVIHHLHELGAEDHFSDYDNDAEQVAEAALNSALRHYRAEV